MNITDISGIGDATALRLKAQGIDSVEAVAQASIEQLVAVEGIGTDRAVALRRSALRLLPEASVREQADTIAGAEHVDATAMPPDDRAKRRKDKAGKKGTKDKKKDKKRQKKMVKEEKKKKKKESKGRKKGKNKRK